MHLIVQRAVRVLEANATKLPSRKPSSFLAVSIQPKPELCMLMVGFSGCFENCCWFTCLSPLLKHCLGLSKIYSTLCESCSENFTWKGMILDFLTVFQVSCQLLLLDVHKFSWCIHFSGRGRTALSLKSCCFFLYIKTSKWHRDLIGSYEGTKSLMNLKHSKKG